MRESRTPYRTFAAIGVGLAALTLTLLATPAERSGRALAAAPGGPIELDKDSVTAIRALLGDIAGELQGVILGSPATKNAEGELVSPRDRLMTRAIVPQSFDQELTQFVGQAAEIGTVKTVAFTGFEVRSTLWFGVLPVQEVDLNFWTHESRTRVLRLSNRPTTMRAFGNPSAPGWQGVPAESFGTLAEQVLTTLVSGQCDAVPVIRSTDHKVALPVDKEARKGTLAALERFQRDLDRACKAMKGLPFHRVTWQLGDLNGVLTTKTGVKIPFKVGLTPGPQRDVRLYHITRPVAPPKAEK